LEQQARTASVAGFEQFFHSHAVRMKSLAYNLLGNIPDAEDAVQDALLKAYRGAKSFGGQSSLATWIYRILVNTCHDLGRTRRRRGESQPEPQAPPPSAGSGDIALRVALERAIRELSERQRTVFLLYEVEGFRHGEIAGIMEIPEATSRSILFEAKKELQRILRAPERQSGARGSAL
jgi:RNA polymerase sigma-70 factor (ECF subfamily)